MELYLIYHRKLLLHVIFKDILDFLFTFTSEGLLPISQRHCFFIRKLRRHHNSWFCSRAYLLAEHSVDLGYVRVPLIYKVVVEVSCHFSYV